MRRVISGASRLTSERDPAQMEGTRMNRRALLGRAAAVAASVPLLGQAGPLVASNGPAIATDLRGVLAQLAARGLSVKVMVKAEDVQDAWYGWVFGADGTLTGYLMKSGAYFGRVTGWGQ